MPLRNKKVVATIAVKNIVASRAFYERTLGFSVNETDEENYISYQSDGVDFLVYKSEFAGTSKATVATWAVGADIEGVVKELQAGGIQFEHYALPGTTLQGDIHVMGEMKNAWFKDPDGNILALVNA